ncbi:hypothetical protein FHR72_002745 [Mycolicibacterium iranicum]|uniref:Uncharacterized protein n=1 Tax=Mycolicibacterium iranicum TaxID=912594 RepID=A0A839QFS2_MYCIR|nr:hypothetical protein [Mycolicibacterium iranicum]MBB2991261.1 hypothetical protein [Mycolicibacterium iranicum]
MSSDTVSLQHDVDGGNQRTADASAECTPGGQKWLQSWINGAIRLHVGADVQNEQIIDSMSKAFGWSPC